MDLRTMLWKEWHETVNAGDRRTRFTTWSVALLIVSVLMPLQQKSTWFDGGALAAWAVAPIILLPQVIADAFAGERERHTLETLLASRLPDRAILFGKILTPVLWSWLFVQVAMLLALVPVNLANGEAKFYALDVGMAGMALNTLTSVFVASAGVLFSLRASSVRQAQQFIGLISLSFVLLPLAAILVITALPENLQEQVAQGIEQGNGTSLFVGVLILFGVLDMGLIWLADIRFRRSRLILD